MHLDLNSSRPSTPMVVIDKPKDAYRDEPDDERSHLLGEGSSHPLEPAPGYEPPTDLPPEFAPYHAEYDITSTGDVYSHDPHLNQDGEALYRFLLAHASIPPNLILKCRGTHPETRVRHVTRTHNHNGRTETRTEPEMYTETIIDFDFSIDISQHLRQLAPIMWTVPDDEPAYRGGMKREVLTDVMSGVRRVPRRVVKAGQVWREQREKWGLPPWLSLVDQITPTRRSTPASEKVPSRSELTMRQWADRYCASGKSLKSFTFNKVVYGWNFELLTQAIRSTIQRVSYAPSPTYTIEFTTSASKISVRPASALSRALSKTWVLVLLWITLVYPFIWLYRRFRGGKWEVAGSAFPLCAWKHCDDSAPGESVEAYQRRTWKDYSGDVASLTSQRSVGDDRVLSSTVDGVSQLVGTNEKDWFQTWESTIVHCVTSRLQGQAPLITPYGISAAGLLDDFRPPEVDRFAALGLPRDHEYSGYANLGI